MKKEILIVDDQPDIRLLLQDILLNEGYEVITAATGREALETLEAMTFDGIILDYKLPVINGLEVLFQMAKADMQTPALVITGMKEEAMEEIAAHGLEVEMLAKPFNVQEVCSMVRALVQNNETP